MENKRRNWWSTKLGKIFKCIFNVCHSSGKRNAQLSVWYVTQFQCNFLSPNLVPHIFVLHKIRGGFGRRSIYSIAEPNLSPLCDYTDAILMSACVGCVSGGFWTRTPGRSRFWLCRIEGGVEAGKLLFFVKLGEFENHVFFSLFSGFISLILNRLVV